MLSPEFPRIAELPLILHAQGWHWEKKSIGFGFDQRVFWIGTDDNGRSWIVKMRGNVKAVDERVYASLSQHLGICTQSSSYLVLPGDAEPLMDSRLGYPTGHQLAIWQMDEHEPGPCNDSCPVTRLPDSRDPNKYFDAWLNCGVTNPRDWFDATMLGYFCRKGEPTGRFLTKTHWWVQIDNDWMFGLYGRKGGSSDSALEYVRCDPMMKIGLANKMLKELCFKFAETTDQDLERFLELPSGYRAKTEVNHCRKCLKRARTTARYVSRFGLK